MINIDTKGEIAHNEQILFFPRRFPFDRIGKLPSISAMPEMVDCKLFQF